MALLIAIWTGIGYLGINYSTDIPDYRLIYRIVYFLVFLADGLLILLRFAPKKSVKDTNADSDSTRQFNTTDEE